MSNDPDLEAFIAADAALQSGDVVPIDADARAVAADILAKLDDLRRAGEAPLSAEVLGAIATATYAGPTREECAAKFNDVRFCKLPGEHGPRWYINHLAACSRDGCAPGCPREAAAVPAGYTPGGSFSVDHGSNEVGFIATPSEYVSFAPPPVPRSLRPRWLGPLNFCVLQWFGVRLQRTLERDGGGWRHGAWTFRRWVLPLTGWWSRYVETRGAR